MHLLAQRCPPPPPPSLPPPRHPPCLLSPCLHAAQPPNAVLGAGASLGGCVQRRLQPRLCLGREPSGSLPTSPPVARVARRRARVRATRGPCTPRLRRRRRCRRLGGGELQLGRAQRQQRPLREGGVAVRLGGVELQRVLHEARRVDLLVWRFEDIHRWGALVCAWAVWSDAALAWRYL